LDVEHLIGTMIQGALAGGGKRSHRAGRYLRGGRSSFLNASTLLALGGLVWGAIETMQQQGTGPASAPPPRPATSPTAPPAGPADRPPSNLPPLPASVPAQAAEAAAQPVPEGAAKIVRLMVSAARADGDLSETERETILQHARAAGVESLVAAEIARPTPLARIVEGIDDLQHRADLYVLAFGIVRGDEKVSGAERIYLAQLASLLGIEPEKAEQLEREAGAHIDAAGQGQGQ
jgi:uncharacterized membrane protein YebE (DUF533 family)